MGTGAVGHVVVDAHGEGVGLLEHHAHLTAQLADVHAGGVNVLSLVEHLALHLYAGDQVVHTVQRFKKCGLAAAGGADEGGDAVLRHGYGDVVQRLGRTVPQVQIVYGDDIAHRLLRFLK